MSKAKLLASACFAAFALSALLSATALAGEWDVNGKPITSSVALANTALALATGKLLVPAASTTLECKAHELLIKGGKLLPPDGILAEDLTFHECVAVSTGGCSIAPLILTVPIHGLAHLDGVLNTLILVLPETKNTFATIKFEGETCALLGTQPVTGGVDLLIHEGAHPRATHVVLAFSLPGKLKVGGDEAILEGITGHLKLASGETWNFL